jgi:hypothetical protein
MIKKIYVDALKNLSNYLHDSKERSCYPYIYDNTKNYPEDITVALDFCFKNRYVPGDSDKIVAQVTLHSDGTWSFNNNCEVKEENK